MNHEHTSSKSTVVCVTDQFACDRLIKIGRKIADLSETDLYVVNVVASHIEDLNQEALEHLFTISMEYNASMNVIHADNPSSALCEYIEEHDAFHVVTGSPKSSTGMLQSMWKAYPDICFYTVAEDCTIHNIHSSKQYISK